MNEGIGLAEFTILELVRLGNIDKKRLLDIRELFHAIDDGNKGSLTIEDLSSRDMFHHHGDSQKSANSTEFNGTPQHPGPFGYGTM